MTTRCRQTTFSTSCPCTKLTHAAAVCPPACRRQASIKLHMLTPKISISNCNVIVTVISYCLLKKSKAVLSNAFLPNTVYTQADMSSPCVLLCVCCLCSVFLCGVMLNETHGFKKSESGAEHCSYVQLCSRLTFACI